jgi:hypothetical protein
LAYPTGTSGRCVRTAGTTGIHPQGMTDPTFGKWKNAANAGNGLIRDANERKFEVHPEVWRKEVEVSACRSPAASCARGAVSSAGRPERVRERRESSRRANRRRGPSCGKSSRIRELPKKSRRRGERPSRRLRRAEAPVSSAIGTGFGARPGRATRRRAGETGSGHHRWAGSARNASRRRRRPGASPASDDRSCDALGEWPKGRIAPNRWMGVHHDASREGSALLRETENSGLPRRRSGRIPQPRTALPPLGACSFCAGSPSDSAAVRVPGGSPSQILAAEVPRYTR